MALGGYINRRLPWWMRAEQQTGLTGHQRRKAERRGSGPRGGLLGQRYLSDDPERGNDWLYEQFFGERPLIRTGKHSASRKLPVFEGYAGRGWQKEQMGGMARLGYSFSPNTVFSPYAGTIGGLDPVKGLIPKVERDRRYSAAGAVDTSQRGRDNPNLSTGGPALPVMLGLAATKKLLNSNVMGGFRWGAVDAFQNALDDQGGTGDGTSGRVNRMHSGQGGRPELEQIGTPITSAAQNLLGMSEQQMLELMGQYRAVGNLGIYGPGGIQSILGAVEGPENQLLQDLPGRVADQTAFGASQAADTRRRITKGASASLGPTGVQRPGMAAQMGAQMTVPLYEAQAAYANQLQQGAYNLTDQIALGQGERRAGLLEENMRSKLLGLQGMSGQLGQNLGALGRRYWDTQDPVDKSLNASTQMAGQNLYNQRNIMAQNQVYNMYNTQQQHQNSLNFASYQARLQDWMDARGVDRRDQGGFLDFLQMGLQLIPGFGQIFSLFDDEFDPSQSRNEYDWYPGAVQS
jgi:hypothetical protein